MSDAEGERAINPEHRDEMVMWARRYVVERSIYGVDVNPLAVEMAKLSLWLTTLAKDRPFTFLDHSLRCGDSLVGVDEEQLRTWSLDRKGEGRAALQYVVRKAVDEALALRQQLQAITVVDATDAERKEALLRAADAAMDKVRLAGDLLVAPSFVDMKAKERADLRDKLLVQFSGCKVETDWLVLRAEAQRLLDGQRTLHWPFEFPEVFGREAGRGFDAVVGNPPFLGGKRIKGALGDGMVQYFRTIWPHASGSATADLVAFFFLQSHRLIRECGRLGLVATNTIAQGDTRQTGLDRICEEHGTITAAASDLPWPGQAAVHVSLVHISKALFCGERFLDGIAVGSISSSLKSGEVVMPPQRLALNRGKAFAGSYVLGLGFVMEPSEAEALLGLHECNREVVFPYLNGEDLNSSPTQSASRWVIDFRGRQEDEAKKYAACFQRIERLVYPERQRKGAADYRKYWWRHGRPAAAMYEAIAPLRRVLVAAEVSKHLALAFVPNGQVLSHMLSVFASDSGSLFAVLQSWIHEAWARRYGSSLETRLRYTPSDCFETCPLPSALPGYRDEPLREAGDRYYERRRLLMLQNNEGLTKTYNRFHDPDENAPGIVELRRLHVEMDNVVRDAYGWADLDLEHGWIKKVTTEEKRDKKTGKVKTVERVESRYTISERARQEVLRRLLALNHKLYAEEAAAGLHDKGGKKAATTMGDNPPDERVKSNDPKAIKKARRNKDERTMSLFEEK